jgi:tetratricopeptide (TPR) repeat protein
LVRVAAVRELQRAWGEAAALYESSLEVNPALVPALIGLARIKATHLDNPQEALELARKARSLAPQNPAVSHLLGTLVFQSGDYTWAYSLLRESSIQLSEDAEVLFDLAWACCALGRWDEAVVAMERVVQLKPASRILDEATTFLRMDAVMDNLTEAEANLAEVQTRLEAEPDYVPGLMVMGLVQEQRGDFMAALGSFERILRRFPGFSPAVKASARLCFGPMKDIDKAHGYAVRAREALPQDTEVARLLGLIEYQRSDYSRAAQLLSESAGSFATDAELHYRLGMAQYQLKAESASRLALTRALELSPDSPLAGEARKILAELN